jgi:hypothetical protein
VSEAQVESGSVSSFGILRRGKPGPLHIPWKHPALKTGLDIEFRGARVYITRWGITGNGNSGLRFHYGAAHWRSRYSLEHASSKQAHPLKQQEAP